jgi:hypothetical protein
VRDVGEPVESLEESLRGNFDAAPRRAGARQELIVRAGGRSHYKSGKFCHH